MFLFVVVVGVGILGWRGCRMGGGTGGGRESKMELKRKDVHIGTRHLTLVVSVPIVKDTLSGNMDGDIEYGVNRTEPREAARDFSDAWSTDEIDRASKELARYLVGEQRILPVKVGCYVDDRVMELTREQRERFMDYCRQEAG